MGSASEATTSGKPEIPSPVHRAMSETYSLAAFLRILRDYPKEGQRLGVGDAVHDCRNLLERLERIYQKMSGTPVPDRKAIRNERTAAERALEREALRDVLEAVSRQLPKLSSPSPLKDQFTRSQRGITKKLEEFAKLDKEGEACPLSASNQWRK
jgi:hypothetical protein